MSTAYRAHYVGGAATFRPQYLAGSSVPPSGELSGTVTLDPIVVSGALSGSNLGTLSGTVTLDPLVVSGSLGGARATLSGTVTLAPIVVSGSLEGYAVYSDARATVRYDGEPTRIGGVLVRKARP